ncbi:hypothetical protein K438DRAFT_1946230 [Mycena galopus ATCC 62051]|nr:hypothetical protein K438DRAFT_1946230 [Mycena galopus ATCC 62051]
MSPLRAASRAAERLREGPPPSLRAPASVRSPPQLIGGASGSGRVPPSTPNCCPGGLRLGQRNDIQPAFLNHPRYFSHFPFIQDEPITRVVWQRLWTGIYAPCIPPTRRSQRARILKEFRLSPSWMVFSGSEVKVYNKSILHLNVNSKPGPAVNYKQDRRRTLLEIIEYGDKEEGVIIINASAPASHRYSKPHRLGTQQLPTALVNKSPAEGNTVPQPGIQVMRGAPTLRKPGGFTAGYVEFDMFITLTLQLQKTEGFTCDEAVFDFKHHKPYLHPSAALASMIVELSARHAVDHAPLGNKAVVLEICHEIDAARTLLEVMDVRVEWEECTYLFLGLESAATVRQEEVRRTTREHSHPSKLALLPSGPSAPQGGSGRADIGI